MDIRKSIIVVNFSFNKFLFNFTSDLYEKCLDKEIQNIITKIENNNEFNTTFDLERINNSKIFNKELNISSNSSDTSAKMSDIQNHEDRLLINTLKEILTKNKFDKINEVSSCRNSSNPLVISLLLEIYIRTNIDQAMSLFKSVQTSNLFKNMDSVILNHFITKCISLDRVNYVILLI